MVYEGTFLDHWIPIRRSLITNQFCNAVRSGSKTPSTVIEAVRADAKMRMAHRYYDPVQGQDKLLAVIDEPEALEFARFIIRRESLSPIERQKYKAERDAFFRREHMKAEKPTDKQLGYLRDLGCELVPQTKLEAHDLIEEYVGRA